MKKILVLLMGLLLIVCVYACTSDDASSDNDISSSIIVQGEEENSEYEDVFSSTPEVEDNVSSDIQISSSDSSSSAISDKPSVSVPSKPQEDTNKTEKIVYRTPSGKRYHLDPDCGGKNSYSVGLDSAKSAGLTPCKKCAS